MSKAAFHRFPTLRFLLALALAALWVRSHWRSDVIAVFVGGKGKLQLLCSDRGRLVLAASNVAFGPERAYTLKHVRVANDGFAEFHSLLYDTYPLPTRVLGTYLGGSPPDAFGLPGARYHYVVVPIVYPFTAASVALALGLRTFWLRRRWGTRGICGGCGYDLRASEGRCPECGTAVVT